jgi:hypothetical protein
MLEIAIVAASGVDAFAAAVPIERSSEAFKVSEGTLAHR